MHPIHYKTELWRRQDWQKGTRHYCFELKQNLFGQWVVIRRWGRITAVQGQSKEHDCDSYEEGVAMLDKIERRRMQRGYRRLSSIGSR